jgi:non-ribosomal peptide synthetase component E (peptide arylation enzyme)
MKHLKEIVCRLFVLGVLLAGLAVTAQAQQAAQAPNVTQVQQSASKQDVATFEFTSASTGATISIPAQSNQSIYITRVRIENCAGASAVTAAAVTTVTTTNLGGPGATPVYTLGSGTTAGQCQGEIIDTYPTGLKNTVSGTAVTYVLPTFATNQTVRVSVSGFYAFP